jgi:hypothetical protein
MAKGNPNPSPATRFGSKNGNPINLGGKTVKQREAEYRAAENAAIIRDIAISGMLEALSAEPDAVKRGELARSMINSDSLRLFKDSEDRAHGTPKQSVDMNQNVTGNVTFKTVYE